MQDMLGRESRSARLRVPVLWLRFRIHLRSEQRSPYLRDQYRSQSEENDISATFKQSS